MNAVRLTIVGLSLIAMASPCIADDDANEKPTASDEKVCINARVIRSFDGLSDNYLFIEETRKTFFLVTMKSRCPGLRDAYGIAIDNATSRMCSNDFAEIKFRDEGIGLRSCRIGKIEAVESKNAAKALIKQ